jgi:Flp pilus assembly protein TadG
MRARRPWRVGRSGATAVEFALVAWMLILASVGVIQLGLLMWTQEALESAAAQTARCAALGATTCTNAQQYAVNIVSGWTLSGVVTIANVWVQANATCTSTSGSVTAGKFTVVVISTNYWATAWNLLPKPLGSKTLKATACYPTSI